MHRLAPEINYPFAARAALKPGFETFAAQLLNQRRRQKGRDDDHPLVGRERIHSFPDERVRILALLQQGADIEASEMAEREHQDDRLSQFLARIQQRL
jgi:hypothetical protein